jgi:hypothetical protein
MHRVRKWFSCVTHAHSVRAVIAVVLPRRADIAADCKRCDFVWLGRRFEHNNKVIRAFLFRMAIFSADLTIEAVRSCSPERRSAFHFAVAAFSTFDTLHILGAGLIQVVINSAAVAASPL